MNEYVWTEEKLSGLRERVVPFLTGQRLRHTLAVEKEIAKLGALYLPEKTGKLRAAALLHDITKKLDTEKQLQILAESGIMPDEAARLSPSVFHAMTGAITAEKEFPEADGEILAGIRWHTTGRADMTVFECLVYLADYIEETRTFDDCVTLRRDFYGRLENGSDPADALTDTMIESFDLTIAGLIGDGLPIAPETVAARNSFLLKKNRQASRSATEGHA